MTQALKSFAGLVFAAIVTLGLTSIANAQERKLNAAEIEKALSGNTVDGDWKGTAFKQYFAPDGGTTYVAKGSPPSIGKWKVDAEKDQYCSWWQGTGWDCYNILSGGQDIIIWEVPSDGYRANTVVLSGRQL